MAFATIGTAGIQAQSIDLSTKVTGTLPVPNGGLGIASGTTGQFLKFTGTETLAPATSGITAASQWRVTSTFSGDAEPIASNWELNDTTGYASLGANWTQSSGIFTAPSTGFWLITFICTWYINGSSKWLEASMQTTTNNSSYAAPSITYSHITQSEGDTTYATATAQTTFDVTDTAQCKIKFNSNVNNNTVQTLGSSNSNMTGVTFLRLGDT